MKIKSIIIFLSSLIFLNCSSETNTIVDGDLDPEMETNDPISDPPINLRAPFSISLISNKDSDENLLEDFYLLNIEKDATDVQDPINLDNLLGIQTEDYVFRTEQFNIGEIQFVKNQLPISAIYASINDLSNITKVDLDASDLGQGTVIVHQNRYLKMEFFDDFGFYFKISIYNLENELISELEENFFIGLRSSRIVFEGNFFIAYEKNEVEVLDIIDLEDGSLIRSYDALNNFDCLGISGLESYILLNENINSNAPIEILDYNSGDEVKTVPEPFGYPCLGDFMRLYNFNKDRLPSRFNQVFQDQFLSLPAIYYTESNDFKSFNFEPLSELYNNDISIRTNYIDVITEIIVVAFSYSPKDSLSTNIGLAYVALDGEILFVVDDLEFWPTEITKQ